VKPLLRSVQGIRKDNAKLRIKKVKENLDEKEIRRDRILGLQSKSCLGM
jgi:hypothetical protein